MAESCPWPPPVEAFNFRLRSNIAYYISPLTGQTQLSRRSGGRWEFDVSSQILDDTRLGQWRAFIAYCQEEGLTFYWNHYPKARPLNFPAGLDNVTTTCDATTPTCDSTTPSCDSGSSWGLPVVNGTNPAGNRTFSMRGFVPGTTLKMGDCFAFDNGTFREMHELKADVTADSNGNMIANITPGIRRQPADGASIYLDGHTPTAAIRMACEVIVADPAQASWQTQGYQMRSTFKLIEMPR